MRKTLMIFLIAVMMLACTACGQTPPANPPANPVDAEQTEPTIANDYPRHNINGIVQWGAGGGTDSLMRPLAALAEDDLGVAVVMQNMPGATGSIATQYVYDADADGYHLLMGAENPTLYQALGISERTYADFDCVFLIGDETVGIIVSKNSHYSSFTEIIAVASSISAKNSTMPNPTISFALTRKFMNLFID